MDNRNKKEKLGIALVGLGSYSEGQLAPALQQTAHCYLAGIVTGSEEKAKKWQVQYNIPETNTYNYQNFEDIAHNSDIDIIYIVLPNSMHAEYVIRAATTGKHIICEKPMALSVEDCNRMIDACNKAGVQLSIGYRLHFEPFNAEMMRIGKEQPFGPLKKIKSDHGMADTDGWRIEKALSGGGPLQDLGIYCIQACRYTTGTEPIAVTAQEGAKTKPEKFKDVEESMTWQMEFPGGITAECSTTYVKRMSYLRAEAERGFAELDPAFDYNGLQGKTGDGPMQFADINQQAAQMDDFALALKEGRPTPVPGEMGRQDVAIIQAIYKAMETGQRVELK
ncbi:Gfo/Idh/MocA family protein [Paracnuella aquatica]|uniref:Gfo/Idh/MocA family protein n=1 Tax=Paracnuella aquatica TaxID=2268757 RepID=UPI000DEECF13|nr:Gfo/Idh/MocA family oxidoreductase [Paracnuella aquatica]RPD48099.1 gfo/Idh/MocA family oxidoreductase [Paracnuella aquatica]